MSKRQKTYLEKLLKVRKSGNNKPDFIYDTANSDDFYKLVIKFIDKIEDRLYIEPGNPSHQLDGIIFEVFPLIETISYSLFKKPSRHYLKKLGYPDEEADMIIRIFRNGYIHNIRPRKLKYNDGDVSWSILCGGGNTSPMPYDPGYTNNLFPEDNEPAEIVFDYVAMPDGSYHASLSIDRLLAQIRHDVEQRSKNKHPETVSIIIGEIVKGRRRSASRKLPESGKWR